MEEDFEESEISEIDEVEELEILRGRHIRCTCDEDYRYCEVHQNFG